MLYSPKLPLFDRPKLIHHVISEITKNLFLASYRERQVHLHVCHPNG